MRYALRGASFLLTCVLVGSLLYSDEKPISIGMIPDGLSAEERAPLKAYLSKALGRPVNLVTPDRYSDTVDRLADGTFDFACLGALMYVRSHQKYGFAPLVQRTSDLQFHAVFITGASSAVHSLRDLKGRQFAFGDINSASGHLIPYRELTKAGINPEVDMKIKFSGGHPVTAALVESGAVDAGALDESVFNSLISSGKIDSKKVRVFHTSEPFVDYVYVARKDLPEEERDKFSKALLSLREGRDDTVLKVLRAKQFVPAKDSEYETIRQIAKELKMF